jgi:hypothetical protein
MEPINEEPSASPSSGNPSSSNPARSNPARSNPSSANTSSSNRSSSNPSSSNPSSSDPSSSNPPYVPPASPPIPIQRGTWNGCICCQPGGANVPHSIRVFKLYKPPGNVLCSDCGGKSVDGVCGFPYCSDHEPCWLTMRFKLPAWCHRGRSYQNRVLCRCRYVKEDGKEEWTFKEGIDC